MPENGPFPAAPAPVGNPLEPAPPGTAELQPCPRCPHPLPEHYQNGCGWCACKEPGRACPDHDVPLLDVHKVHAFVTLLDWQDAATVVHACEAQLEIKKERARA